MGYYLNPKSILEKLAFLSERRILIWLRIVAVVLLVALFLVLCDRSQSVLTFLKGMFKGRSSYASIVDSSNVSYSLWFCCAFRLAYYAFVAFVSVLVMLLTPRRSIPLLTRTGLHSLQVYVLHAFVYYACNNWKVAAGMYSIFPDPIAGLLPFIEGLVLSLVLGYPNFLQTGFDKLKKLCGVVVVKEDSESSSKTYSPSKS